MCFSWVLERTDKQWVNRELGDEDEAKDGSSEVEDVNIEVVDEDDSGPGPPPPNGTGGGPSRVNGCEIKVGTSFASPQRPILSPCVLAIISAKDIGFLGGVRERGGLGRLEE